MISTGIKKIDELLGGGFAEKSVVLIEGSPGVGKEVCCHQFLYDGLKDSIGFYVFTEQTNEEIEMEFNNFGMDIGEAVKKKKIFWIDAGNLSQGDNVINCKLDELFTISMAVKQVLEGSKDKKIRGIINILSPALMMNSPLIIYKFVSDLISTLKRYSTCTILMIEKDMHEKTTIAAMEQLCDVVIEMRMKEENMEIKRQFCIKKNRGKVPDKRYHSFELGKNGIEVVD